jgi:hypothetical protein
VRGVEGGGTVMRVEGGEIGQVKVRERDGNSELKKSFFLFG